MFIHYNAHIWSKTEYHNGALIIAGEIRLRKLDKMQRGFLYELGSDDKHVFVEHNFAPPSLRRTIGILGFLHKRNLGTCHPALQGLFFRDESEWTMDFIPNSWNLISIK